MEALKILGPSIVPVFALLTLGVIFRRTQFLTKATIDQFKKVIVNFSLPSLLFLAFFEVSLTGDGLFLLGLIFASCALVLILGYGISSRLFPGKRTAPFLFSGFEAGMLGYALYLALFGQKNLGVFAATDLGQVLFVFLVLVPLLKRNSGQTETLIQTLTNAVRSPIIGAIALGLVAGAINRGIAYEGSAIFLSLTAVLSFLGSLTVPLVTISVGYTLVVDPSRMSSAFSITFLRLLVNGVLAWILTGLIGRGVIGLPTEYIPAVWVMFLLPPPFVIPAFLKSDEIEEEGFASAVLSTHTVLRFW